MIWETSPAAAELEERMMEWLREMTGLPSYFEGVIQDSASSATLAAIITAREKVTGYSSNKGGMSVAGRLRIYCSTQAHSSVEKGAGVAGIGRENLVRVPVKDDYSIDPDASGKPLNRMTGYTLPRGGDTWHDRYRHRPMAWGVICREEYGCMLTPQ
jgi:aromatic-L-amino-acid decarboxylase